MKIIITESQHDKMKLLRKLPEIDVLIEKFVQIEDTELLGICNMRFESFFDSFNRGVIYNFLTKHFNYFGLSEEHLSDFRNLIEKYIEKYYKKVLESFYTNYCELDKMSKQVNESVFDNINDDNLLKIINKIVKHIYSRELDMVEEKDGYIRFYSVGPKAPFHKNLAGRIWINDKRLVDSIKKFFGTDWDETMALIAFYFSKKYDIKTLDAKPHSNWFDWEQMDYEQYDNPDYNIEDDDEDD